MWSGRTRQLAIASGLLLLVWAQGLSWATAEITEQNVGGRAETKVDFYAWGGHSVTITPQERTSEWWNFYTGGQADTADSSQDQTQSAGFELSGAEQFWRSVLAFSHPLLVLSVVGFYFTGTLIMGGGSTPGRETALGIAFVGVVIAHIAFSVGYENSLGTLLGGSGEDWNLGFLLSMAGVVLMGLATFLPPTEGNPANN